MSSKIESSIKGSIIGFVVGDALGVPVEFMSRDEIMENPVTDMRGYGTHNQPKGTWSDDSSLTLCLVEALSQGYDLNNLSDKFVKWYRKGYLTASGKIFDIGNGTRDAILALEAGVDPIKSGGESSYNNGNGSLMRILPLAFYLKNEDDLEKRFNVIHDVSSLTHRHIVSKIGCCIYVEMAINLIKGYSKFEAYENTKETILNFYAGVEYAQPINKYVRVLKGNINELAENEIESTGYVVHTLEASLWCLLNNNDFNSTVLKAVNLGDDTDTTGAVAGGLAGIYYGYDSIPKYWVNEIANIDKINKLIGDFSATILCL